MNSDLKVIFEKAERYIYRNARYLDVARWNYHFHLGDPNEVIKALHTYQNTDGGFGHRLEADIQTPESTPIGTWTAITMLRELDFPVMSIRIIKNIIKYLDQTPDFNGKLWTTVNPRVSEYPHAPWWGYSADNGFMQYNPTAEFIGIILRFGNPESAIYEKALKLLEEMIQTVNGPHFEIGAHELSNFLYMLDDLEVSGKGDLVPDSFKEYIRNKVPNFIEMDKDKYTETNYFTGPNYYIHSRESLFYKDLKGICDYYCSYLLKSFKDDGYWDINWTWGNEPVPNDSLRDWRGAITVNNMVFLNNFL